ncbi:MAG TPA: four helix bundle protein [Lacunisphaera sp.]|nr:four helix bundle protein [Lacunisphaera sp.]
MSDLKPLKLQPFMSRLSQDLRQRCKAFASGVIRLYDSLSKDRDVVRILGRQLVRSGTSVAAHAREASRARSDDEFCSKLDVLLQEGDESQLWLELLQEDCGVASRSISLLHQEVDELISIFTTMVAKLRKRGS